MTIAADSIGKILNYANISKDVGVSNVTVQSYFQILEDTLIGFFLQPYHRSVRKRQRLNPKFYLFDCGVTRALTGTTSSVTSAKMAEYGHLFEQFVIGEIFKAQSYRSSEVFNYYLTTHDGSEIDLIIEQPQRKTLLIEIKSSRKVSAKELAVLEKFRGDFYKPELICISQEPRPRQVGNVAVLPVIEGIAKVIGSLA